MSYSIFFVCFALFSFTIGQQLYQFQYGNSVVYGTNTMLTDLKWNGKPNIITTGLFTGVTNLGGSTFNATNTQGIFLAKYNASFGHVWSQGFVGSGSNAHNVPSSVAVDNSNNIYVLAVWTSSSISFGGPNLTATGGGYQHALIKYDSNGNFLFNRNFSGSGSSPYDWGDVTVAADGSIYVGVPFTGTKDLGGGSVNASSSTWSTIAKYSNNGTFLWNQTFGNSYFSLVQLATDSNSNCYAAGLFTTVTINGTTFYTSTTDAFVMKLDSTATFKWLQQVGSSSTDQLYVIAVDSNDNVYAAGHCGNTITVAGTQVGCGYGMLLVKFDSNGNFLWGTGTASIYAMDEVIGIDIAPDNTVVLTGPSGQYHKLIQFDATGYCMSSITVASASSYVSKPSLLDFATNGSRIVISGIVNPPSIALDTFYYVSSSAMYLGNLVIPSPSATPSVTPSGSPSHSTTPSVTPSHSITPSGTPSSSATPSGTPSASPTPSTTPTPSATPSLSPSPTVTPSTTASTTPTASVSPTLTPSVTPSSSVTPTATCSPSPMVQKESSSADLTQAQIGGIVAVVLVFGLTVAGGAAFLIWRKKRAGFVEHKDPTDAEMSSM